MMSSIPVKDKGRIHMVDIITNVSQCDIQECLVQHRSSSFPRVWRAAFHTTCPLQSCFLLVCVNDDDDDDEMCCCCAREQKMIKNNKKAQTSCEMLKSPLLF